MKNEYIMFRLTPELKKQFFSLCEANKEKASERIRKLIEKDIKKNKN